MPFGIASSSLLALIPNRKRRSTTGVLRQASSLGFPSRPLSIVLEMCYRQPRCMFMAGQEEQNLPRLVHMAHASLRSAIRFILRMDRHLLQKLRKMLLRNELGVFENYVACFGMTFAL